MKLAVLPIYFMVFRVLCSFGVAAATKTRKISNQPSAHFKKQLDKYFVRHGNPAVTPQSPTKWARLAYGKANQDATCEVPEN